MENEREPDLNTPPPADAPRLDGSAVSSEERTWALIAHLSTFTAFISGIGVVLGPLVVWLIKRDTMPFVAEHAREALNFNITVMLAGLALIIFTIFTIITVGIGALLTIPAGLALFALWIVFTIIAAINANNGQPYRYPFTLRLIN